MNDEGEKDVELTYKMNEAFSKLGIDLEDKTTGQIKSTFQIMKDLSEVFPTLDKDTRNYYAALIGGKTQVDVVNSVLTNFKTAIDANKVALNSSGSAMRENEKYMASMEAKLNELKSAFENFSRGTLNSDLLKSLIDVGTILVKFADNDIGRTTLSVIALSVAVRGLSATLKFMIPLKGVQSFLISTAVLLGGLTSGATSASIVISALTKTMLASPLFWGVAAVAGIVAITKAVDALNVTLDEQKDIVNNLTTEYQKIESDLKSLEDQIKSNISRIEELNALPSKSVIDDDEIINLELSNTKLQTRIDLLNREKALKLEDLARETKKEFKKEFQVAGEKKSIYQKEQYDTEIGTFEIGADITEEQYAQEAIKKLSEYNKLKQEGLSLTKEEQIEYTAIRGSLNDIGIKYSDFANREGLAADDADRLSWSNLANAINDVLLKGDELPEAVNKTSDAVKEEAKSFAELSSEMGSISDKMSILNTAQEEIASSGGITAKTLQSMTENNLLGYLQLVEGELVVNTNALNNLAVSTKNQAIESLKLAAVSDIQAIAMGNVEKASPLAQTAIGNLGKTMSEGGQSASEFASGILSAAGGIGVLLDVARFENLNPKIVKENIDATLNAYSAVYSSLNSWTGSSASASGGAKSTTDAWKAEFDKYYNDLKHQRAMDLISEAEYLNQLEQLNNKYFRGQKKYVDEYSKYEEEVYKARLSARKSRLEKQKSRYESTISYITSVVDKEIDALNAEKDALQKVNDERQDSIRLQEMEEALARAKSQRVRIYREGKGFVYEEDSSAIAEAQGKLNEFEAEKAHKKELDRIDEKIKGWEAYKKQWQDVVKSYTEQQDALIAEQILGANAESDILNQRIDALYEFAEEYREIMESLERLESQSHKPKPKPGGGGSSSGGGGGGGGSDKPVRNETVTVKDSASYFTTGEKMHSYVPGGNYTVLQSGNGKTLIGLNGVATGWVSNSDLEGYADGTSNASGRTPIKVNENGLEAIVTPDGTVTSLPGSGYGMIPNPLTKTLTNFAQNPIRFMANLRNSPQLATVGGGAMGQEIFNINGNISVNANDATAFLSSIKSLAIQRTTDRK